MSLLRGLIIAPLLVAALGAQQDVVARARDVLAAAECQTTLPGDVAPPVRGQRSPDRLDLGPGLFGGWQVAQILAWGVAGAAVLWLIAATVRGRGGAASRAPARPVSGASVAAPAVDAAELPDHARLASAGDFAGALQALLRHAFARWGERTEPVPPHATARELLRRARRVVPAESLAHLVGAVERVRYAGAPASRGDYDAAVPQLAQWEQVCRTPG